MEGKGINECDEINRYSEMPGYVPQYEFEVNQNSGEAGVADEVHMPFPATYYIRKPYDHCEVKTCHWYYYDKGLSQCMHTLPNAETCTGGTVDACVGKTEVMPGYEQYKTIWKTDSIVPKIDICFCCSVGTDYNNLFNNTQCTGPVSYEVKTDVIVPGMV